MVPRKTRKLRTNFRLSLDARRLQPVRSRTLPTLSEVRCAGASGLLKEGGNRDPKLDAVVSYLLSENGRTAERWFARGCVLFSQYYDTVHFKKQK